MGKAGGGGSFPWEMIQFGLQLKKTNGGEKKPWFLSR